MAMFLREAVGLARGSARKTALLAAAVAGLVGAGAYWLVGQSFAEYDYAARRWTPAGPMMHGAAAKYCLALFQAAEIWLAALAAPAAFAALFSADRARGRLDLLLTTHVTRAEIVAGKYCSRLLWGVGLLAIPLPIMLWIDQFGGPGAPAISERFALAVLTLAVAGSVGMAFGAWCRTPLAAALLAYLVLALAWVVGPMVWLEWCLGSFRGRRAPRLPPWQALEATRFSPVYWGYGWVGGDWFWNRRVAAFCRLDESLLRLLPIAAALVLATPLGLRPRELGRRRARWWRWMPERWAGIWPVRDPLWLRARQAPVHDRSRALRWTNGLTLALFALAWSAQEPTGWLMLLPFFAVATVGIAAAFAAAADKQSGFFDQVLLTALAPGEIHRGYTRALAEHLRVPIAATVLAGTFTWWLGRRPDWRLAALGAAEWLVLWRTLLALAVALGLWARNATEAWLFQALTLVVWAVVGMAVPAFLDMPLMWSKSYDAESNIVLLRLAVAAAILLALVLRRFRGAWPAILATLLSPVLVFGPLALLPTAAQHYRRLGNPWTWSQAPVLAQFGSPVWIVAAANESQFWLGWALHAGGLLLLAWLVRRQFVASFDSAFRPLDPLRPPAIDLLPTAPRPSAACRKLAPH